MNVVILTAEAPFEANGILTTHETLHEAVSEYLLREMSRAEIKTSQRQTEKLREFIRLGETGTEDTSEVVNIRGTAYMLFTAWVTLPRELPQAGKQFVAGIGQQPKGHTIQAGACFEKSEDFMGARSAALRFAIQRAFNSGLKPAEILSQTAKMLAEIEEPPRLSSGQAETRKFGIYFRDGKFARSLGDPLLAVVEASSKQAAERIAKSRGIRANRSGLWAWPLNS